MCAITEPPRSGVCVTREAEGGAGGARGSATPDVGLSGTEVGGALCDDVREAGGGFFTSERTIV